ncbi:prepilin-type N-terminal cleavage/methylation domain-containing protein [Streptomyces caniscabiei]|uniref:PilW family protein n=1 Tax=Streptomyces caniscabiei TaxID=2746961 RepID=UPI00299FBE8B|nr:prepilin-type N-terminal cleavage/methylation domain-containing protein [Streptomyces caniscabiei]MDX2776298.1 prepilin-type N-terminal cleavage/methylation domain-containing protein [Streptomyces caniscabiei]
MNRVNTKGFTLIELMLAMTFISVLLIAIAMTTIQMSNIYTKGITLREVNQAGRTVSDDLQRSIGASSPFDLGDIKKYIHDNVGGRLCVGKYSYIWSYGEAISNNSATNRYQGTDNEIVRFAKVSDPAGNMCLPTGNNGQGPLPRPSKDDSRELLASGDRDLALHNFTITETAREAATSQAMYAISFVIGTNDQAQLTTNDTSCRPPSDDVGAEDYCSVNQFDIVARAGNQSEGQ